MQTPTPRMSNPRTTDTFKRLDGAGNDVESKQCSEILLLTLKFWRVVSSHDALIVRCACEKMMERLSSISFLGGQNNSNFMIPPVFRLHVDATEASRAPRPLVVTGTPPGLRGRIGQFAY